MRGFLTAGCCVDLAACSAPGADVVAPPGQKVPANALRTCHAELRIAGPFDPRKAPLDRGQTGVFAASGNGVFRARAPIRPAQATAVANQASGTTRAAAAPVACLDGFRGLYRGNLFCTGKR